MAHSPAPTLWLWLFRVRALFLVVVGTVGVLAAPADRVTRTVIIVGLLSVLAYNQALARRTARRGAVPEAMAWIDQLLCGAFALAFPHMLMALMIASAFDLAVAALAFRRRTLLLSAGIGTACFTVVLLVELLSGDRVPIAELIALPAYAVAAMGKSVAISTVVERGRAAGAQLRSLVTSLDIGVWEYDVGHRQLTYVSPAFLAMAGLPGGVTEPEAWLDRCHRADRRETRRRLADIATSGTAGDVEHRWIDQEGSTRWLRHHVTAEQDRLGRTVSLRAVAVDITEERAEAVLLGERSRQQSALVDLSRAALRGSDMDALLAQAADVVGDVLRVPVVRIAELRGSEHLVVRASRGLGAGSAPRRRPPGAHERFVAEAGVPVEVPDVATELRFAVDEAVRGSGARAGISVAIPNRHGAFAVLDVFDRRPRRYTPDEVTFVQGVATALGAAVARLSVELQLGQAQKMEAMGQLAGGVAHDFNNLMTAILGYAELLEPSLEPGEEARDNLQQLLSTGRRAAALTAQLLTLARGRVVRTSSVDVHDLLSGLEDLMRHVTGERITVAVEAAPGISHVAANRDQLEQAVLNLLVNARDAMPHGGHVTVRADRELLDDCAAAELGVAPGPYLRLTVSDTGVGMPPQVAQRALEPFFTTKGPGQGTGLGLSTVYALCTNCAGTTTLDTAPGQGTSVRMHLPAVPAPAETTPEDDRAPSTVPTGGSRSVLVVEDQMAVRRLVEQVLGQQGFQVRSAADGEEALAILSGLPTPPDLIISDVVMPHMDGTDLLVELRASLPDVPVLLMSGYVDRAKLIGAHDQVHFLHKPFGVQDLLTQVHAALAGAPVTEPALGVRPTP